MLSRYIAACQDTSNWTNCYVRTFLHKEGVGHIAGPSYVVFFMLEMSKGCSSYMDKNFASYHITLVVPSQNALYPVKVKRPNILQCAFNVYPGLPPP